MLIRLLVVVLTLVGPMPFRVCTCAAGLPTQTAAERPAPAIPAATKPCGCQHDSVRAVPVDEAAPAPAHTDSRSDSSDPTGGTPHQDRHERDCPAANPTPVVRDAVTPPAVDAPTDCLGSLSAVWVQPSQNLTTSLVCRLAPPRASKLPLYITLLSIQN